MNRPKTDEEIRLAREKIFNSIGVKVLAAGDEGDINFLEEAASTGQFNPLTITEVEDWNYLHKINLNPRVQVPKETIQFYLDKGVAINAQDCYGMTPLHYAVRAHNFDAVKLLLENGADLTIENQDGLNPLWQAFVKVPKEEDVPIIKLLIEHGADPYKKNKHGVPVYNALKRSAKTRQYLQDLFEEVDKNKPNDFVYKSLI